MKNVVRCIYTIIFYTECLFNWSNIKDLLIDTSFKSIFIFKQCIDLNKRKFALLLIQKSKVSFYDINTHCFNLFHDNIVFDKFISGCLFNEIYYLYQIKIANRKKLILNL